MIAQAKSYEISGIIDEDHHLVISEKLPVMGPKKVKVIVLVEDDNLEEEDFLRAAQAGGSFDFWNNAGEDIYTIKDGKAVR